MELLMIVPSRGRPTSIAHLINAWKATGAQASLKVAVDDDDPALPLYRNVVEVAEVPALTLRVAPRVRVGPTLDQIAVGYAPYYDAVGFMGDDHRPRTPEWDVELCKMLRPGEPGVVYGNDLFQQQNLPTAVVMSAEIPRALGRITPPGCLHLFLDNYWKELGEALGTLYYREDVIVEHMHPQAHKAEWDEGYVEANSGEAWDRDSAAWARFKQAGGVEADVLQIRTGVIRG